MRNRDFLVIPLIALMTVVAMLAASEWLARLHFVQLGKETRGVWDALHGARLSGSCVSRIKSAEGPWVENAYNACGYRTRESCGATPAGPIRLALLGASTAQGYKVPYEQAFAPRAAQALAAQCGRAVEIQNMGVPGYKMIDHYLRLDEALALKPEVVILALSAYELVDMTDPDWLAKRKTPELLKRQPGQASAAPARRDLIVAVDAMVANSRAVLAAQHYLYQDRGRYVDLFLMHGDKADYLRHPFSAKWEQRLSELELMLGEMAESARRVGVPLVLLFGPQRVQAALVDPATWPAGVDPSAIDRRIAEIGRRTGVVVVDGLQAMTGLVQPWRLYYPVDGHMTGEGHALLAQTLVTELLAQRVGPFSACR